MPKSEFVKVGNKIINLSLVVQVDFVGTQAIVYQAVYDHGNDTGLYYERFDGAEAAALKAYFEARATDVMASAKVAG